MSAGTGYTTLGSLSAGQLVIYFGDSNLYAATFLNTSLTASQSYTLPNASGTLALTTDLSGYLPLTGGTLTGGLEGTTGYFASSGGSDTFAINHSSGNGIALNITKGGNNEGLYVNKTSGSGNAVTIIGTLNATTLVKSGGTSSQFLMADGSVNTSVLPSGAYLPLSGGTLTGALSGTSATFTSGVFNNGTNSTNGIKVISSLSGSLFTGGIEFIRTTVVAGSKIEPFRDAASGGVGFNFLTTANNSAEVSGTYSTALSIASTGAATFSSSVTAGGVLIVNVPTDNTTVGIFHTGGGTTNRGLKISTFAATNDNAGVTLDAQTSTGVLAFATAGAEKMRITSGGNVGIGTSSPNAVLEVAGTSSTSDFRISRTVSSSTYFYIKAPGGSPSAATMGVNGTDVMVLNSSGNVEVKTSGAYISFFGTTQNVALQSFNDTTLRIRTLLSGNGALSIESLGTGLVYSNSGLLTSTNPSDSRLKDNITDISWGLNDILKLRPVSYNWKDDKINQGIQFGFIAQEVQEVMPEAIKEFGDDVKYLGLEKDAIYATLVKAIQEQQQQIEELKALIAAK